MFWGTKQHNYGNEYSEGQTRASFQTPQGYGKISRWRNSKSLRRKEKVTVSKKVMKKCSLGNFGARCFVITYVASRARLGWRPS
jgi:hypothetical protein